MDIMFFPRATFYSVGHFPFSRLRSCVSLDCREATKASSAARGDTSAVRLALRILLPHRPERWYQTMFWESAQQDHFIGRERGMEAAYNGILV